VLRMENQLLRTSKCGVERRNRIRTEVWTESWIHVVVYVGVRVPEPYEVRRQLAWAARQHRLSHRVNNGTRRLDAAKAREAPGGGLAIGNKHDRLISFALLLWQGTCMQTCSTRFWAAGPAHLVGRQTSHRPRCQHCYSAHHSTLMG